jgi:hypothetical protein
LYPATEVTVGKYNIFHEDKTGHKIDAKGNKQRCNMGFKGKKAEIQVLCLKYILMHNNIDSKPQYGISPATSRIPKGLQRHKTAKGGIKEIYRSNKGLSGHIINRRRKFKAFRPIS